MNAVARIIEPSQAVLRWVNAPRQDRTRKSLGRLLDAAEEILEERSFEDASIADIARAAGSSVGAFYRRFGDKPGLLRALHERFCEDADATGADALDPDRWRGASLGELLDAMTLFLVEIYRERGGLFRSLMSESAKDENLRLRTQVLYETIAARMTTLLVERRHEFTHPDPERAAMFGIRLVLGTLDHTIQLQPKKLPLSDAELGTELIRAFRGYVGVVEPARLSSIA